MKPISLLIADDHEIVRKGLKSLLETFEEVEVVGETGSLDRLPSMADECSPDVILLDVKFPVGNSFHYCRLLKSGNPAIKVLYLTSHDSDEIIFQCIDSGADGFLLKDVDPEELLRAITGVHHGKSILDPSVTARIFSKLKSSSKEETHELRKMKGEQALPELIEPLTPQELKVLEKVAQGLTNKEVAEELRLSPKTVKNYLSHAMGKLGFNRRAQVAAYYTKYYG